MSMIGKTLAHYEITSQLGKGGMGEVYQAKDRKLGRDVAIKVLPEEFARDADRVARFQREAKLLASLNHPNIAAIYGLEESGGTNFLVLELVEGQTLADRIKAGPVAVEEALKLALQIAEALEAAHEKGVIHRDLKPANVKVTPEGKVKVLDFGLAKAFAGDQADLNLSNSPTLSDMATQQGVILGTAAYMSPEQACGKAVDKRADIWAFGVVLYEMLTGRSLFAGENVSQTLARVLERQPDFSALPPNLHPKITEILQRCLVKEARNRCHDIADVRIDVQKILADPGGVFAHPGTAAEPRPRLRALVPWAVAVLGIVIAGAVVWNLRKPEPRQIMRFEYMLPEGQQFGETLLPALAVSPDGRQFVYSTTKGLYLRSVDELTAKLIAGTEGATEQPFFSPDGKSVGYFSASDRKLKKVSVNGGVPVTLCSVSQAAGAWWAADNSIVFGQYPVGSIMRVSSDGGTPEALVKTKIGISILPQILSDGKSVLYTDATSFNQMQIAVQSLQSGEPKALFAGAGAQYLPTGHLVYLSPNNNLFAVAFDLARLEVSGEAVPIVQNVEWYAVSDAGTLAYVPTGPGTEDGDGRTLIWVDRKGKEEALHAPPANYHYPKISPDGTRVALTAIIDDNMDIWIWDPVRESRTRLTFDKALEMLPVWTPDGKRIVFASDREGHRGIYWKAADGTGTEEKLALIPGRALMPWSWSSDGKTLLIMNSDSAFSKYGIGTLSMEGNHAGKMVLEDEFGQANPNTSRDGKYVAYLSAESGHAEIYVRPFPEVNKGKWQISNGSGDTPLWSPDGRELFYISGDAVMAVSVETEPTFNCGKPRVLFKGSFVAGYGESPPWDISPDGKRFLMIKPPQSSASAGEPQRKINIVLNWFEELKQRVPVK